MNLVRQTAALFDGTSRVYDFTNHIIRISRLFGGTAAVKREGGQTKVMRARGRGSRVASWGRRWVPRGGVCVHQSERC